MVRHGIPQTGEDNPVRLESGPAVPVFALPDPAWLNGDFPPANPFQLMIAIDAELDTSGLQCPLPILKAKKALASLRSGQVLRIIATDPDSVRDFETFSRQLGHALLDVREDHGQFHFLLRKA